MPIPGVYQIKYAPIDTAAASGNTTIAAAVSNRCITLIGYALVASGAASVKFTDGAGGSNLTGAMSLATNGGVSYAGGESAPACRTSKGSALVLNVSGAVQISGHIVYVEEDS